MTTHTSVGLLHTKLNLPRLSPDMILRQCLLDRFEQAAERPVILVSAPAGYGKTTVVDSWLRIVQRPYAWLSLDEHDSNLIDFASYLVAALRTANPEAGSNLSAALAGQTDAQPEVLAVLFLKDLEALREPLVLVLDDYHLIHSVVVHTFMARVVQRTPAGIHLVLTSRADPSIGLARLRGRGQLAEFRSPDLRFTRNEAAELIQRLLGDTVADEVIDLLHERTEGWPVGLQLTALALRETKDRLDFARRFAQSNQRPVMDYLLNEVLSEVSDEEVEVILRASLLDRFCAPLWDVLAEGTEAQGQGQTLIDRAWQSNLFMVALDAEGLWYRYHHLFGDLLRRRLGQSVPAETLANLHRRVSVWFEQHDLLAEAIIHAIRAGEIDWAARLVESNINTALNREDWRLLERWLMILPKTALQRPGLLVAQAYLQHFRFNLGSLEKLLDESAAALTANAVDYSEHEIEQLRGSVHMLRSNLFLSRIPQERLHHAELALRLLAPEARFARSMAETFYGFSLHQSGRTAEGLECLSASLQQQTNRPDTRTFRLLLGLIAIHDALADLGSLETVALTLLQLSQAENHVLSSGWALLNLGWIHYQRNELDAASEYFSQGIVVRFAVNARTAIDCYAGLALTQTAQGCPEAAVQTATGLRKFLRDLGLFNLAAAADALDLRLALVKEAQASLGRQWYVPVGLTTEPQAQLAADLMVLPVLVAIHVYLASGTRDSLASASDLLQQCRHYAESTHSRRRLIEIGVLETLLYAARGEHGAALSALCESVLLAEPGGTLRLIADAGPGLRPYLQQLRDQGVVPSYVTRILAACTACNTISTPGAFTPARTQLPSLASPNTSADIVEELTLREQEVLRLLARGLTNKEIATELMVSPNTVKKHTANLYQKLDVSNRRRAVRVARALGYLPIGPNT